MGRFVPKTVAGQLMFLLIVVLLLAQAVNLVLLVGERQLQSRTAEYREAIERAASNARNIPNPLPENLPYQIRKNSQLLGAFFLSEQNRAERARKSKQLPKHAKRFEVALQNEGLNPINVEVVLLPDGPPPRRGEQDGRRRPPVNDDGFRPRPRDGEKLRDRPNRPRQNGGPRPERRLDGRPRRNGNAGFDPGVGAGPNGARAPGMQEVRLSAEIQPGVWYNVMIPYYPVEALTPRILLATAIMLALALLAVWLFARRISRPLSELTHAADRLGRGDQVEALDETGPEDVQKAARAFNVMQGRLTRMLETQRTMLRAVGHDLRTPLTALRIRAENIPAESGQEKFIATIDDMTAMTKEILGWAKDASDAEALASVDIDALIGSIVDDYADQNIDVTFDEGKPLIVPCRRVAIKRALQNLIGNAVKYGKKARLSVEPHKNHIQIHIDDEGPGIPPEKLDDVLMPFVRLETSRSKQTGGIGLGLSITETIVEAHGGKLELSNRKPTGLRATIELPR